MKVRCFGLAPWALTFGFASAVHAQDSSESDSPVLTLRAGLPLTGVIASDRPSGVKVAALSASLRLFDLAEVEVNVPYWGSPCDSGFSYGGRVGASPSLVALPETRTGWNVRLPVLAGYDFFVLEGGGCEYEPDSRAHVVTAAIGLDFTYFWSPGMGVNFRALGFAGNAWYRSLSSIKGRPFNTQEITDSVAIWGATFDAGISVRF